MKTLFEIKIDLEITARDVDIMRQVADELNGIELKRLNPIAKGSSPQSEKIAA